MGASAKLEERFRVLAPDLPGFGFSEAPPKPWGAAEYARVVAGLLVATGFGSADVVGHSRGGVIATALAASRPDLVSRLVLVAAPVVRLPASGKVSARARMYRAVRTASNLLPPFRDRIREWGIQKFGSEDYRNAGPMRATMAKMLAEDWRSALPKVEAPALLIYGEKDEEVPLAVAHEAMRELPDGARLVVMPDAGHFPFLDDTEKFVDEVTRFLQPAEAAVDG
jgi:pimeloyl-ACP methyl ester carboxylesterase